MGKMYYSEEETCQKLGVNADELMEQYVNTAKLQMYQDGGRHVYKAADVDAMAPADAGEADDLGLAPEIDTPNEAVSLSDADELGLGSIDKKEDTVITAEGISIFDDEDLEIGEADDMAKTQIAPSLDDQIALDGVGSGSGLLDLTRESDDTSLGAEVLDHIDMEGLGSGLGSGLIDTGLGSGFTSGLSSGLGDVSEAPMGTPAPAAAAMSAEPPVFVEAVDASSGFFTGLLVGASLVMLVVLIAAIAGIQNKVPGFLVTIQENLLIVVIAGAVVSVVAGAIGMVVGKAFQGRTA